jgi:hypothetical protein
MQYLREWGYLGEIGGSLWGINYAFSWICDHGEKEKEEIAVSIVV